MNGTIIDINGITCTTNPIEMQDSTDKAHIITLSDGEREVTIEIMFGKITQITNEKIRSNIDK